jgi:hypothetical protein
MSELRSEQVCVVLVQDFPTPPAVCLHVTPVLLIVPLPVPVPVVGALGGTIVMHEAVTKARDAASKKRTDLVEGLADRISLPPM